MIDFDPQETESKIKLALLLGIREIMILTPEVVLRSLNLQYSLRNGCGNFAGNPSADGWVMEFPPNSENLIMETLDKLKEVKLDNNPLLAKIDFIPKPRPTFTLYSLKYTDNYRQK